MTLDELIIAFDRGLRTLAGPSRSARATPGDELPESPLEAAERRHAAGLMRVNHAGEVCAQALYQGQALTARDSSARSALSAAAQEEVEHLAWTEQRIAELGGHRSWLNPLWYGGSYALGVIAGLAGDRWNLGFLAETERQVVQHLESHLQKLPAADDRSRAIVVAMREDEARHATTAVTHGAAELPLPVKLAMRAASRVMTATSHWV